MSNLSADKSLPEPLAQDAEISISETTTYPAQFKSLDKVRACVGRVAKTCGFKPSDVYNVQLAVDEAFTNIIEHAYGGESQDEIDCSCQYKDGALTIILWDRGRSFNPSEVPEPDLDTELENRQIGGLGLYFIHQLMDEVEFTFVPATREKRGYNVLKMVKYKEKEKKT